MSKNNVEKQAIERYCLECCDDDKDKVEKCFYTRCPLWKYRLKNKKKHKKSKTIIGNNAPIGLLKKNCKKKI